MMAPKTSKSQVGADLYCDWEEVSHMQLPLKCLSPILFYTVTYTYIDSLNPRGQMVVDMGGSFKIKFLSQSWVQHVSLKMGVGHFSQVLTIGFWW